MPLLGASPPTTHPFHRDGPFLLGADISWVQEDEANGATFYDHGQQKDVFQILKDYGFNSIRLRVFVDPASGRGYASTSKEAYCDLAHTLAMARRAREAGLMGLLIDLHYSDTWVSPGKQAKPAAWEHLEFPALRQAVYDFTFKVLTALKQQGTTPDMVQIGNEITNGMLWPDGRAKDHFDQFADLLKSGISAARDVDPAIKVVLHHDKGRDNRVVRRWLDNLLARGVQFDVIGLSCNDTGPPANWQANFDDLAVRYPQFGLMAAEYSYNKRALNDIVYHLPDRRGLGTFIWEPTRHHEVIFDPNKQTQSTTLPTSRPASGTPGHRPRTGRFDANDLINLYSQMAQDYSDNRPP
jgi:arabinogalactan endo-1,4-beta-galactosidase